MLHKVYSLLKQFLPVGLKDFVKKLGRSPGKAYAILKGCYYVKIEGNTQIEKKFKNKIRRYKIGWQINRAVVLTEIERDYEYGYRLALSANYLATKKNANIGLVDVESDFEKKRGNYGSRWFLNKWKSKDRRLENVYLGFAGKIVHRNNAVYADQQLIRETHKRILASLKTKADVANIEVEGIVIGDLIYDSYLRFNSKYTLDLNDRFLDIVISDALNIFYSSKELLRKNKIAALVVTYTTYIKHGILVRLCLEDKIPVYTVANRSAIVNKCFGKFPLQTNPHFFFPQLFKQLDRQEERLLQAKKQFEERFKGKIDPGTFYMKQSAFSTNYSAELDKIDFSNTILVLAHCFFDSPHIYRGLIFPDFYEWITFTLDTLLKQKEITVLVKPHPNGVHGNDVVFEELKKKYAGTRIVFIDKKTSTLQLLEKKPRAVITAYGTAAAEFAYFDIPVFTVFDNPFTAYTFACVANSIQEYEKNLNNIERIHIPINKNEILQYYYMQHIYFLNGHEGDYLSIRGYPDAETQDFLNRFTATIDDDFYNKVEKIIKDGFEIVDNLAIEAEDEINH